MKNGPLTLERELFFQKKQFSTSCNSPYIHMHPVYQSVVDVPLKAFDLEVVSQKEKKKMNLINDHGYASV